MRKSVSFINWNSVTDTISNIQDDSSGSSRSIEGENSLNCNVPGVGVREILKTIFGTYIAGVLKVSNMIWVIFSLFALGFIGASVRRTGCSSGATLSSL
jgi:hypothetical protein